MKTETILKWQGLISLLWIDVIKIISICQKQFLDDQTYPFADDERFSDLLGLKPNRAEGSTHFLRRYDSAGDDSWTNPYFTDKNKDTHLQVGLTFTSQRHGHTPRIVELTIRLFKEAKSNSKRSETDFLPSPLYVIYQLLIDPNNACSAAYALCACRNWLSDVLKVTPVQRTPNKSNIGEQELLWHEEFESKFRSFVHHEKISAPWPDRRTDSRTSLFICHFMAMHGMVLLRFPSQAEIDDFLKLPRLQSDGLEQLIGEQLTIPQVRLASKYREPPTKDEIANQIFGFPIPIKGADVVFNGGLLPSAEGGLVMSVSGPPGVGKTSFALALASSLAPFGTQCHYLSFEESERDIQRKLEATTPDFHSDLSLLPTTQDWFTCEHIEGDISLTDFTESISLKLGEISEAASSLILRTGVCPGIVVFDNLNQMISFGDIESQTGNIRSVAKLIERCRLSQVIVIFISADDVPSPLRLDYLVDFVAELAHQNLRDVDRRPRRVFNLIKSRHQVARNGSHVFHLGSGLGFRIIPSLDSLMEKKEVLERRLPDRLSVINTLNYLNHQVIQRRSGNNELYLNVYRNSTTLIHGIGPGGKAGLGLKLLMTPALDVDFAQYRAGEDQLDIFGAEKKRFQRSRILVVSFLFPLTYYAELTGSLSKDLQTVFANLPAPRLDELTLNPGYINPQDFLVDLVGKIDRAQLEGEPFTGVLLDGLHNVFLQFQLLQKNDMVWATLYSILSRYDLTVVSTFTNFDIRGSKETDQTVMRDRMTPFLNALVSGSDFYLFVNEEINDSKRERKYLIEVRQAIGQQLPDEFLEWDRELSRVQTTLSPEELNEWKVT